MKIMENSRKQMRKTRIKRPPFKEFMEYYMNHKVIETAEHFGVTDRTLYNWLNYYTDEGHTFNEIAIQR